MKRALFVGTACGAVGCVALGAGWAGSVLDARVSILALASALLLVSHPFQVGVAKRVLGPRGGIAVAFASLPMAGVLGVGAWLALRAPLPCFDSYAFSLAATLDALSLAIAAAFGVVLSAAFAAFAAAPTKPPRAPRWPLVVATLGVVALVSTVTLASAYRANRLPSPDDNFGTSIPIVAVLPPAETTSGPLERAAAPSSDRPQDSTIDRSCARSSASTFNCAYVIHDGAKPPLRIDPFPWRHSSRYDVPLHQSVVVRHRSSQDASKDLWVFETRGRPYRVGLRVPHVPFPSASDLHALLSPPWTWIAVAAFGIAIAGARVILWCSLRNRTGDSALAERGEQTALAIAALLTGASPLLSAVVLGLVF